MKPNLYLDWDKMTMAELTAILGITLTQANQYVHGGTTPRKEMMLKFCLATRGRTDANDFFDTGKEIIEAKLLKMDKLEKLVRQIIGEGNPTKEQVISAISNKGFYPEDDNFVLLDLTLNKINYERGIKCSKLIKLSYR